MPDHTAPEPLDFEIKMLFGGILADLELNLPKMPKPVRRNIEKAMTIIEKEML